MADAAFNGAGQSPGLEGWRIENMQPVKLEKVDGTFFSGDSYIILSTSGDGARKQWNLHFWLGKDTSQVGR
ncbi:unnamed protein product [Heterosigma akashiwo]